MPASMAMMKHAATTRSAVLALARSGGSAGSSRGVAWAASGPSWPSRILVSAGGGVPMTRCRPASVSAGSSPGSPLWPFVSLMCFGLPVLRCDPQCRQHHEEQHAEKYHEALSDRADPAQAESSRVRLRSLLDDVGDDVALVLRGEGGVVEDRHRLVAGQHGLVNLGGRRLGQRGRVLAVGQRTAGADEVVALRAVGDEELLPPSEVRAGGADLGRGRDGRPAGQRLDVGGDRVRLAGAERYRLARGLRCGLLRWHPAGADLEIDGGGSDPDQTRRYARDALGRKAVAGRAVLIEQVAALGDLLLVGSGR